MTRTTLIALLTLAAACTPTPREAERTVEETAEAQDALAKELAGLTPGRPSTCFDQPVRVQSDTKAYGSTLVFRVSDSLKYRNDTAGGCERLARGDILVTRTPSGRLCRGDIARTLDPATGFTTGSCALGDFTPYKRP